MRSKNANDILDVITDLVSQDSEVELRLEAQAEVLREVKCIKPVFGQLIDANDVKYLLSLLALSDKDFAERFPTKSHFLEQQRQRLITAIEEHLERCPHCSLKRSYDLERDARIKQVCRQNGDLLLELLAGDSDLLEECERLVKARSAHT
jgi:hypothetical protein